MKLEACGLWVSDVGQLRNSQRGTVLKKNYPYDSICKRFQGERVRRIFVRKSKGKWK